MLKKGLVTSTGVAFLTMALRPFSLATIMIPVQLMKATMTVRLIRTIKGLILRTSQKMEILDRAFEYANEYVLENT